MTTKTEDRDCRDGTPSTPCLALALERELRRETNQTLSVRLGRIERNSRVILAGIATMVLCASLEYAGVIRSGSGKTVWSHAVVTGLRVAIGGQTK